MIDFFVMIAKFFMAIGRSLRYDASARALLTFVVLILVSGTIFFMEVEHWGWLDSLYYCVNTLTTVGTGDLRPHTDVGKIFTIIYLFMGVGAVLAALQLIARHALAGEEVSPVEHIRRIVKKK